MTSRLTRIAFYTVVLVGAFLSLTKLQLGSFADDPGVGWHLQTGLGIAESGLVPHVDAFLSEGRPWVADQWLSDLGFSLLYAQGGWPILYALGIVLYLSVFFFVLFKGIRRLGYASSATLIGLLIVSKLSVIHFIFRPILISFLFFSIVFTWLIQLARSDSPKISLGEVLIGSVFFAFWTNLHPSFPMGIILLVLCTLSFVAEKFIGTNVRDSKVTHGILACVLMASLATLLNPYGFDLHESILFLSHNEFFMKLHQEWKPLQSVSAEGEVFRIVFGVIALGVFVFGRERLRISLFEFAAILMFASAALVSVRFVPYFAIVSAPSLVAVLHELRGGLIKRMTGGEPIPQHHRTRGEGALFLACSVMLISTAALFRVIPTYNGSFGPSQGVYPYGAVAFLKSMPGGSISVYNHPNWGGFMTLMGEGKIRPVLDDRNTLLGEIPYRGFLNALSPKGNWLDEARAYGASYTLFRKQDLKNRCNDNLIGPVVYEDDLALVTVSN